MRILVVCSSWRVFGAETVTLKMLEGFRERGHEQLAVTSIWTDGEFSRRLRALNIPEVVMPFGAVVASLSPKYLTWTLNVAIRLPALWYVWRRTLRRFRPQVILWTSSRQPFLLLPCLDRTPSFLVEFTRVEPTRNMLRLYRLLTKRVTGFVAVSDFMAEHLKRLGAPAEQVHVIKSGVFFERERSGFESCGNKLNPETGAAVVGIAGQITSHKGHDDLLEAVGLLRKDGTRIQVKVFGSGPTEYVNALKVKVAAAGLQDDYQWMGYERDKAKMFGGLTVCVVPSCFGDPFPTVAMEAAAHGLPVVATRDGGLPEIVEDGVTGWLVDVHAPAQLADRIEWLIRNPERARAMGAAGRERVFRHLTVERMVEGFEELFRSWVGESAGQVSSPANTVSGVGHD